MPVEAVRDLVALAFLSLGAVFLGFALYIVWDEREATQSWRPWPPTLGWALALLFIILAVRELWPGYETITGQEPLDVGRAWLTAIVVGWAVVVWRLWRQGR